MYEDRTRNEEPLFEDADAPYAQALANVRAGMTVVDAVGEELGGVEHVRIGDPAALTTRGSMSAETDLGTRVVTSVVGAEPAVPEPKRSQFLRYGYIKLDGSGLTDTDRYVRGDKIRDVSGDTVRLSVNKAMLLAEA